MVAVAVLGLAGSGALAQGVSFSGSAGMGVKYSGNTENAAGETTMESTIKWVSDFDVAMSASGTTDGGLTFGGAATIKASNGDSAVGNSNAYIGGESWKISIGDLDPASDKGKSLGDIGYDGLGVDDVAENIKYDHDMDSTTDLMGQGTQADVEVSFSLGTASLAITAGQTGGSPRVDAKPAGADLMTFINTANGNSITVELNGVMMTDEEDVTTTTYATQKVYDQDGKNPVDYYLVRNDNDTADNMNDDYFDIVQVVGDYRDDSDANNPDNNDDLITAERDDITLSDDDGAYDNRRFIPGAKAVEAMAAEKQDTVWATGVSFDIGSTTLGIGIDSEKLMQASVSADLGAFSGKLFYSTQDRNKGKANENKATGMGVEIGVSAGENTTINAVYAQGKTDYKDATMDDKTDKGFGVGVSHGLGGGATLEAGFAKVKKQTMASVGVSMSF